MHKKKRQLKGYKNYSKRGGEDDWPEEFWNSEHSRIPKPLRNSSLCVCWTRLSSVLLFRHSRLSVNWKAILLNVCSILLDDAGMCRIRFAHSDRIGKSDLNSSQNAIVRCVCGRNSRRSVWFDTLIEMIGLICPYFSLYFSRTAKVLIYVKL